MAKQEPLLKLRKPTRANALKAAVYAAAASQRSNDFEGESFSVEWYAETWLNGADREQARAVLDELVEANELKVWAQGKRYAGYRLSSPLKS